MDSERRNEIAFLIDLAEARDYHGYNRDGSNSNFAAHQIIQAEAQLARAHKEAEKTAKQLRKTLESILGEIAPAAEELLAYIHELVKPKKENPKKDSE